MPLFDQISKDLVHAMKDKDAAKVSTIRFLRAALKNLSIEKKQDRLTDEEVISVLSKLVKQHRDSIEGFKKGARQDLVQKEEAGLAILQAYLPEQMGRDEIVKIVRSAIEQLGVQGPRSTGPVMKKVMEELKGRADGKLVSEIVSANLRS